MIGSYNSWAHEEFLRRVESRCQERALALASGAVSDYGGYQNECGYIAGLREAADISQEIQRDMEKR